MCNPNLAHKVLTTNPNAGVMLPCNVTVYEDEKDPKKTVILAIDPMQTFAGKDKALGEVASEVTR